MPSESCTFQPLRKFFHAAESLQVAEAARRCVVLGKKIDESLLKSQGVGDSFSFYLCRHEGSGSHADGASLTGEADLLNRAVWRLTDEYDNLVTA